MRRAPFALLVALLLALALALALILLSAANASAQQRTVTADTVKLLTVPCTITSGSASPTGGANCNLYLKSDGTLWQRTGGVWVKAGNVGSGTVGQIPKWVTSTTFGDSVITESGGNVGIGTTSPTATLQVTNQGFSEGTFRSVVTGLILKSQATNARTSLALVPGAGSTIADIRLFTSTDTNTNYSSIAWGYEAGSSAWGWNSEKGGTETAKAIYFNATNGQSAATANMFLATNGNVGIGTTGPGSLLEIYKSTAFAIGPTLTLNNPAGGVGGGSSIDFKGHGPASQLIASRIVTTDDNNWSNNIDFQTKAQSSGGTLSSKLYIQSTGNVGIGTTTPNFQLSTTGTVAANAYASQTTGWAITNAGAADFRYLYTDELHAKAFIADLEQALAGGQIISKSVAKIYAAFDTSSATRLIVEDFAGYDGVAVFQAGDYVQVRSFSRAAGSLTIANAYGTVALDTTYGVSGYDAATHTQAWTWTKIGTPTVVAGAGSLALDLGVSGNGYYEVNSIDGAYGANSPYSQIVTWATTPSNKTVRARMGNLFGVTSTAEYGLWAGKSFANNQYFLASDTNFELRGIDLKLFDGATNTVRLDPSVPSFAMGSTLPSGFSTGTGIWMGKDSSAYKFRVGDPSAGQLAWDGSALTAAGWTIGASALMKDGSTEATSAGMAPTDYPFYAGATYANRATAPFRVSLAGGVTATSGTIGGWTLGTTSLTSGTGATTVGLDSGGTNPAFYAGSATPASAPFRVTNAGVLTATGANIVNGVITFDNGAFMKVSGNGFGSTNQFIEWWGPHQSALTSCTEANATYYLKTDGTAYFGGALLAGVLKNTVTGTVLNNTNSAVLGPYASNGNTITINWSLDFYSTKAYVPSDSAGWTAADRTAPTATLKLERSVSGGGYSTIWSTTVCNGTVTAEAPNGVDSGFISKTVVCSGTYTDPDHNTNTRSYRLSFVSDSHVFVPGGVVRNNLSLVSIER
jgi:hypothetical protein